MPTTLDPCIYGEPRKITLDKHNAGNLTKAVAFDLEEYGQRGVQGLPLKMTDVNRLIEYESKRMTKPYIRAGIVRKDLVVTINDAQNKRLEGMVVLCKDYIGIKEKLSKNKAAVVDVAPEGQSIGIAESAAAHGEKRNTKAQSKDEAAFGGVTGDIVLCAHGKPKKTLGRIIGDELGKMTAEQIVAYLTDSTNPKKRLGKSYAGTIHLVGCFTASGGPEAHEADAVMAKRVKDLLHKAGWTDLSVVGMPGAAMTVLRKGIDKGTRIQPGDEGVIPAEDSMEIDELVAQMDAFEKKAQPYLDALEKAMEQFDGTAEEFIAQPKIKPVWDKYEALVGDIELLKRVATLKQHRSRIAKLEGRFGLRNLLKELGQNG